MILEFKNVEKSFGNKKVLKGVSFTAKSGVADGYLGRNGSGKTTSFRILLDIFKPDKGEILLDGKPRRALLLLLSVSFFCLFLYFCVPR